MSDIAEMVFGSLQIKPREIQDARALVRDDNWAEIGEVLSYIKEAEEAAEKRQGIWESAVALAALFDLSSLPEPEEGCLLFLLDARDAAEGLGDALSRHKGRLRFLRQEAEEIFYDDVRCDVLGSWQSSLDFIQCVWGEETEAVLSEITGSSEATARRWIGGGAARDRSQRQVMGFAYLLYDLQERHLWSKEEIYIWAREKIKIGQSTAKLSPIEFIRSHSYCRDFYPIFEEHIH